MGLMSVYQEHFRAGPAVRPVRCLFLQELTVEFEPLEGPLVYSNIA